MSDLYIGLYEFFTFKFSVSIASSILSDLDPDRRGFWNTVNTAMMSISQQLYLLYSAMSFSNTKYFWLMFLFFQPLSLYRTLLLTPKTTNFQNGIGWKTRHDKMPQIEAEDSKDTNLLAVLKTLVSPHMLLLAVWLISSDIRANTVVQGFESWLVWASDNDPDQVAKYTDLYTLFKLFNFPVYLIVGKLIDLISRKIASIEMIKEDGRKYHFSLKTAQLMAVLITMTFNQIMAMLISLILSFQSIGVQTYILFVILSLHTCTLYVMRNTFVLVTADSRIFGRVLGFANCFNLVTAFLLPSFTHLRNNKYDGDFQQTQYMLLGLNAVGLAMPILNYFWIFHCDKKVLGENAGLQEKIE